MPGLKTFWDEAPLMEPPYVHPADRPVFEALANNPLAHPPLDHETFPNCAAAHEPNDLHFSLLPEPYTGDLDSADVFVLQANPGFAGNEYAEQYGNAAFRQRLLDTIRQDFTGVAYRHVYLDPQFAGHDGYNWWTSHLNGTAPIEVLANRVATIDLFPYHSNQFRHHGLLDQLPSVQAARDYVLHELLPRAMAGDITIIVARQRRNWGFTGHEDDGRNIIIYSAGQARGAWMTPPTRGGRAIMDRLQTDPTETETGAEQIFPPDTIVVAGRIFYRDDAWQDQEVTDAAADHAAITLLGICGHEAVDRLADYVENHGPVIGSQVVRDGLGHEPAGAGAQMFTTLFRYAYHHRGVLRYMSRPDGRGRSRYCTLEQALAHREHPNWQITEDQSPRLVDAQRAAYLGGPYVYDLEKWDTGILCPAAMGLISDPENPLKLFEPAWLICVLYEFNLIAQIIHCYFPDDFDKWDSLPAVYTDCHDATCHGGTGNPIDLIEYYNTGFGYDWQPTRQITAEDVRTFDLIFAEFLKRLIDHLEMSFTFPEFLDRLHADPDCQRPVLQTLGLHRCWEAIAS